MYAEFATLRPVCPSICKTQTWYIIKEDHVATFINTAYPAHYPNKLVNKNDHVALFDDVAYPHVQMKCE